MAASSGDGRPVRLWVLSDLHLESVPYPDAFAPVAPAFDVLVCAGDVHEGDVERTAATVSRLARGRPCVLVLGNHEFWNGDFSATTRAARSACERLGVVLLDRDVRVVAGLRFVGATLWTDLRLGVAPRLLTRRDGGRVFSDTLVHPSSNWAEPVVSEHGKPVVVGEMLARHALDAAFLEGNVRDARGLATVVVSHHAPVPESVHPTAFRRGVAALSASDLSHVVDGGVAALWVHGHVHHNVDVRRACGTRILCNPGGSMMTNPGFDPALVVEVRVRGRDGTHAR